ncbi:ABC transporter substrate-binding protein [Cellulomonas dongxiuzhuiae]|uniref:ABC transporter substrate-binding protein n=1 Tax=Cellulomonas dongxiuzhuiae TaxID=2819979 RepID=A0ABX8GJ74_9CELL|nr:ABC transporter substrate-binding protein [Cellulomonas dongxiuzhuiae]MBO3089609.1 ABC transporter substrate-binding protein [Cellulomonas dongxiuzhuiae]MBO3095247.1 ABC transporter substrate-binding protein [Cellulomonas dongxiuzhuiae]QWC16244.1 ABC transporter substrate-binding protein [Cellulomonas dongxiuzhuiae]
MPLPSRPDRRPPGPAAHRTGTVVLLGVLPLLLVACAGSDGSGGSADSPSSTGDVLVEAVAAVPGGLAFDSKPGGYEAFEYTLLTGATLIRNPYVQAEDDPNALTQDLYDFEGVLAESYDVSEDGLTYTFHLREGVLSQAGNPFDADDVLYSYERKWNSTSIAPAISLPAITDPATQLRKIDDHTVSWTVAEAGHGFPLLAVISKISGEIYDKELLEEHATAADPYAVEWSNTNGNFGFGPYVMTDYQDGQQISFEANPEYPLGEPAIKRIIQRVVPDAANRAQLLRAGDVDVAVQLRAADVAAMTGTEGLQTFSVDTNNFAWAFMQTRTPPFDDPLVRQAVFYAIPYEQIIEQVYGGRANPVVGLLNPEAPHHVADGLLEQEYDPQRSLALLEEAGVRTPVSYTITVSNAVPDMEAIAVQIQSFAGDAGFDVDIEVLPPAAFQEQALTKAFQMRLYRDMSVSYESPPYSLLLAFPEDNEERNSSSWEDPRFYEAVAAGVAAGDALSPEAAVHWNRAELVWQEGRAQIQMAKVQPLMVFREGLTGFAHRTDNVIDFSIVEPGS